VISDPLLLWLGATLLWAVATWRKDVSIVDPWWSMGFLAVTLRGTLATGLTPSKALLCVVVGAWALRLWGYLLLRSRGKPEDARYTAFRVKYGADRYWWVSYFQVFLLQATLVWLVSAPLRVAASAAGPDPVSGTDVLAAIVATGGLVFEAVADQQLAAWKARPNRGDVMDSGLWRYSRHPNYFGETVTTWGLWMFTWDVPGSWWTVYAPALMTFLLLRVSGVALLDKHMSARKPAYVEYIRRTPAFIPGRPKP